MVERARAGAPAGHALAMHLVECPRCADRWEAELELSRGLRGARSAASELRSAPRVRAHIMAEFDARRRHSRLQHRLVWGLAAIAALLVVAIVAQVRWAEGGFAQRAAQSETDRATEDLLADNDFMPVPYAAPLAPGEYVEVVEKDLTPAALARMGFILQASYNSAVTAELMVGEDGLPRAVRVPESVGIRY